MFEQQILDTPVTVLSTTYSARDHLAGNGRRFLNSLIDTVFFYILAGLTGAVLGLTGNASLVKSPIIINLIALTLFLAYFIVMETSTGATIGKLLTKTRVVTEEGMQPSFKQILGRSFARLIPFDAFSYLGGNPGWHDSLSGTFVVMKEE